MTTASPTLTLVGEVEPKVCPECRGSGSVPCPPTVGVRSTGLNGVPVLQPSTGAPIPCPTCSGTKLVANFD